MAFLKRAGAILGGLLAAVIVLGLVIDTGGGSPPDDALVYLDPAQTTYVTPDRTPGNSGYVPVSYAEAKRRGAKPDDITGFNVDGPPLLVAILDANGLLPFTWSLKWAGTGTRIERVRR